MACVESAPSAHIKAMHAFTAKSTADYSVPKTVSRTVTGSLDRALFPIMS